MNHLAEHRHEFGQVPDDENSSTDTLSDENSIARSSRPAGNSSGRSSRPAVTDNDAEDVRVPRRAAALRARRALRNIYRPLREQPDFP